MTVRVNLKAQNSELPKNSGEPNISSFGRKEALKNNLVELNGLIEKRVSDKDKLNISYMGVKSSAYLPFVKDDAINGGEKQEVLNCLERMHIKQPVDSDPASILDYIMKSIEEKQRNNDTIDIKAFQDLIEAISPLVGSFEQHFERNETWEFDDNQNFVRSSKALSEDDKAHPIMHYLLDAYEFQVVQNRKNNVQREKEYDCPKPATSTEVEFDEGDPLDESHKFDPLSERIQKASIAVKEAEKKLSRNLFNHEESKFKMTTPKEYKGPEFIFEPKLTSGESNACAIHAAYGVNHGSLYKLDNHAQKRTELVQKLVVNIDSPIIQEQLKTVLESKLTKIASCDDKKPPYMTENVFKYLINSKLDIQKFEQAVNVARIELANQIRGNPNQDDIYAFLINKVQSDQPDIQVEDLLSGMSDEGLRELTTEFKVNTDDLLKARQNFRDHFSEIGSTLITDSNLFSDLITNGNDSAYPLESSEIGLLWLADHIDEAEQPALVLIQQDTGRPEVFDPQGRDFNDVINDEGTIYITHKGNGGFHYERAYKCKVT